MEQLDDIEARLKRLTTRECQVLYWMWRGFMVKEIAKGLGKKPSTIAISISNIYSVFELKSIENYDERRARLIAIVSTAIDRFIANPDTDCNDKLFQKGDSWPPDPRVLVLVNSDLERGLLPLTPELEDPRMKPDPEIKRLPPGPNGGLRGGPNCRFWVFMAVLGGILVALIVLVFLVLQLLNRNPNSVVQGNPSSTPSQLPPPSGPSLGASGVISPSVIISPSVSLPSGCAQYQLSDDFEGNLKPDWRAVGGQPVIINGRLGSASDDLKLEVGDKLCNFTAGFDYAGLNGCRPRPSLTIGDRLTYSFDQCSQVWESLENGNWVDIAQGDGLPQSGHIQLKVDGTAYRVLLNGKPTLNINYGTPQRGAFGLILEKGVEIDNFSVTAP